MTKVRFTSGAADQLRQAIDYIERDRPFAAVRLKARIDATLSRLALFPDSGSPTDESGVRYVPVPKTRYLLFYDLDEAGVRIVRVRHASRKPLHRR